MEPARVGQRTDFDKLTLEVQTNGAVEPRAALAKAADILRDELSIFMEDQTEDEEEPGSDTGGAVDTAQSRSAGYDDTPIEELELGVRSYNCLKREGIETVGDLIARSEQELMCIPNLGRKTIEEVRERLEKNNLKLKGE